MKEIKNIDNDEILTDLICMNLIKRKINNNYMLHNNDEQLLLIIFKNYAKLIEEVLFSDEHNKEV